eukprot:m51a1_g6050 hypothetical protein (402) ;mRNA; r:209681-211193
MSMLCSLLVPNRSPSVNSDKAAAALAGIRVVDLSEMLAGPFCTRLLADMGADVIRVEEPALHSVLNRNKRSCSIDVCKADGASLVKRMAARCDVVVASRAMDDVGLGWEQLRLANPRLIYCSVTPYGLGSRDKDRSAQDISALSRSGILSGGAADDESASLDLVSTQIASLGAGQSAAFAVVCALFQRERAGPAAEGSHIDVSMADTAMMFAATRFAKTIGEVANKQQPSAGLLDGAFACYNFYSTSDKRRMSVGAIEQRHWKEFCRVMGHPEWERPDFFDPGEHQRELKREVAAAFAARPQAEWAALFAQSDCCVEPVLTMSEAAESELAKERGMVERVVHGRYGVYKQLGCCCSQEAGMQRQDRHAPELGEHTSEILTEFGVPPQETAQLFSSQVISSP